MIRPMMYLALSYDHRIVDGKGAVTFLVRVKEALEDPRRLLMDLFTAACAFTYLVARVLYVPAYYFGWAPWRSLIWFVGFAATTLILLAALI
jgi:hypothetical protein